MTRKTVIFGAAWGYRFLGSILALLLFGSLASNATADTVAFTAPGGLTCGPGDITVNLGLVFTPKTNFFEDQEAVVLLAGITATTTTLLFDDTNYTTGVAVVNLASVSTTISVTAYDNQGNVIGTSSIPLAANAKTAVVLKNLPGLGGVAGTMGSVDFSAPIGNLAVLGLRFDGLAFTSIPTSNR